MSHGPRQFWLWSVALCCACSVDPSTHPQYKGDGDCGAGEHAVEIFCVPESCMPDTLSNCYPLDDLTTSGQPPCRAGTRTCGKDGRWGECMNAVAPTEELCDGVDNDCDGTSDEAQLQKSCEVSGGVKGSCAKDGAASCSDGKETCLQRHFPEAERCDGEDNDCDGETDEGLEVACYTAGSGCTPNDTQGYECVPASICAPGTLRCVDGEMQTECADQVGPQDERTTQLNESPLDEDCDGHIDENFSCQNGQEFPCYSGPADTRGRSPCKDGKVACSGGQFGACMNERLPVPETCANEGVDDDCDGTMDDVPLRGTSCSDESPALGMCKKVATWGCEGGRDVCKSGTAATEVCNGDGEDEDCDGTVDEGIDLQTDVNNCGSCKNRCSSGLTCCGGSCVNTSSSNNNCSMCGKKCDTGLTCCSAKCVNTQTDSANCGTCGRPCLLGCGNGGCLL
jgi:hypothetical protein